MASEANKDNFRKAIAAPVDKYVKQQGRNTIELNCRMDPVCEGYVRIPGPDACDFCVTMGASDNFYHTEESAGGGIGHGSQDDLYHAYCNCTVAMVYRRRGELVAKDPDTDEVIPYDGASLVQRYREAGSPTFRKNRAAEAERRRARRKNGETTIRSSRKKNPYNGAMLSDADFEAGMKALSEAESMVELKATAERIVASWPRNANGRNKAQWDKMSQLAKSRKAELGLGDKANSRMEKAWYKKAGQREYQKTSWRTGNTNGFLGTVQAIDACNSFDEIQEVLSTISKKAYITKNVRSLDINAVRPFLSSFVGTCRETLGIEPRINQIRVQTGEAVAKILPNSNGTVDLVISKDFFSSVEIAESQYAAMVEIGLSAGGTTFATMGAHEAAHIAEVLIALAENKSPIQAKQLLKTQLYGKRIVRRAVASYNKVTESAVTDSMVNDFKDAFSKEVSVSVKWSLREAPCEAAQDIDANGVDASVLSWHLLRAMKEVFNEANASHS